MIIHRGTDQIGDCITEIKTDSDRIFIDMGGVAKEMSWVRSDVMK